MTIPNILLSLLLAVPCFSQIREVPSVSAPVVSAYLPASSERTAFELQKDADRLYATLADIHGQSQAGATAADLAPAKRALIADFRGVLSQLPAGSSDWAQLSAHLKDLRQQRTSVEATGTTPDGDVAQSRRRAELNADIYVLQMRAAWNQLMGGSPLADHAFRRNAALWSLVGAFNSAAAARAELGWLEGRDRAEALFGDGRLLVVSRRWRNVHSEIEEAARDARNGRLDAAAEKFVNLAELLRRTPVPDASVLERHREAAASLHTAASAALSREDGAVLSSQALTIKSLIPHPKLAEPQSILYNDVDAAARAQFHALESAKNDYLAVLACESVLKRWSLVLAGPRPTQAYREAARTDFNEAKAWAQRGFVGAKQLVAQNLGAALAALDRGDDALAARHADFARAELEQRRAELERISERLRDRLSRLARP